MAEPLDRNRYLVQTCESLQRNPALLKSMDTLSLASLERTLKRNHTGLMLALVNDLFEETLGQVQDEIDRRGGVRAGLGDIIQ